MAVSTQADVNPPKRPMPAFLASMMKANQNIICTAKGGDVRKASVADLLNQRLRIPIFQRRYCWGPDQWDTLLADALPVANGSKEKHSLGRITCVKRSNDDGRLLVIDGQQRNTTCSLLLAAIRDVALQEHVGDQASAELASKLEAVLFPDTEGLDTWLSRIDKSIVLEEGVALEFASIVPTYCDRASYFTSILPPGTVAATSAEWRRPWEAKSHFVDKLKLFSIDRLISLADVVLHKLEWLFFPISVDGGFQDGTDDLQVIFERLAIRDASFCKPSRGSEFASMGAADFVRNLLLGSFACETTAIRMYTDHWLPIEQAAASASILNCSSHIADILESMLSAFLNAQPQELLDIKACPSSIGGELYPRFRKWFSAAIVADGIIPLGAHDDEVLEHQTALLLQQLQKFAVKFLAHDCPYQDCSVVKPVSGAHS